MLIVWLDSVHVLPWSGMRGCVLGGASTRHDHLGRPLSRRRQRRGAEGAGVCEGEGWW